MSKEEGWITRDPRVMVGKPTIRGTRITVEFIKAKLDAGQTPQAILDDHPHLTLEAIEATKWYGGGL